MRLDIYAALNGTGAALSVGTLASHEQLMGTAQNAPAFVASYETLPSVLYAVDTDIFLFITPGSGASVGSGHVFFKAQ